MYRGNRGYDSVSGRRRIWRRRARADFNPRPILVGILVTALALAGWKLVPALFQGEKALITVLGTDGPLAGAEVVAPEDSGVTGDNGVAALEFLAPVTLRVTAPGYLEGFFEIDEVPLDAPMHLQMLPVVLSGRVVAPDGSGVAGAIVTLGDMTATTGEFGSFEFVGAVAGELTAAKVAWAPAAAEWDGRAPRVEMIIEPFVVRGLRVDGLAAGDEEKFTAILRMAEASTVNALVFDTKEEKGIVPYLSRVKEARDIGAVADRYDPRQAVAAAHERGLYAITRVVVFQDPVRAPARPELALRNSATGGIWQTGNGLGWMDPTNRQAWEYPLDLAVEACEIGFDEIQFDYIRFPTDGDLSVIEYGSRIDSAADRLDTVGAFLEEARSRLHPLGCAVSADIFAIVLSAGDDQMIGQRPEELSWAVDAISPMIYPSHYGRGWLGLDRPVDHPVTVIGNALDSGIPRLVGGAVMRPWLQGWGYDRSQLEASIEAAEQRGVGWLLWHSSSDHMKEALPRPSAGADG